MSSSKNPPATLCVVHIFWSLTFGGIETMLVNIANAQVREGCRVKVMIINELWEETLLRAFDERVELLLVHKRHGSGNPFFLPRLWRLLIGARADVIHLHGSGLLAMLPPWLRKRCCCTLHDMPHGSLRPSSPLARLLPLLAIKDQSNVRLIHRLPAVVGISQAVSDALLKDYGVASKVVCNGIDTGAFRTRGDRPADHPLRIVMVSRLVHEKKGQDLLIEAVASLKGQARVDFIGIGESLDYLQELTRRLGAEDWVRFLGSHTQGQVREELADYDLFVQPSRYEGFGLTVAEAMAAGVPVVVSSGQGPAEVTCGDQFGWTFPNGDAKALAKLIVHLATHYDVAIAKASEARLHVRHTYDVSVTAHNYVLEYQLQLNMHNSMISNKLIGGGYFGSIIRLSLGEGNSTHPAVACEWSERRCA